MAHLQDHPDGCDKGAEILVALLSLPQDFAGMV
jgi:hypothetical protein